MTDSLAAFHLAPEEEEELIIQVGDEEMELLREALKAVHDDGYIVFGPSVPAKRLAHFKTETLPNEWPMLLDPNYLEGLEAGYYPPPQEQVFFLVDGSGKPVPGFPAFPDEQTAIMAGLQAGLITPEMLQMQQQYQEAVMAQEDPYQYMPKEAKKQLPEHVPPPIPEEPMPLPLMPAPNFWYGLLGLPSFDDGKDSPFHWEQRDMINLNNQLQRRLDQQVMQMGMAGGI